MNKYIFYISALILTCQISLGQDIHFSNTQYSPLTLNPALAGANSKLQANINYRNQWSNLGTPFRTFAASLDARVNSKSRNRNNILAVGFNMFSDKAGDVGLVNNSFGVNAANHLKISSNSTLGVGINIAYVQRSINQADGKWASQYNGNSYDANISSGESIDNFNFRYVDAGAGILYTYAHKAGSLSKNVDRRINVGLAAYHLNKPNISLLREENDRLPIRFSAFASADIEIENSSSGIMPAVYFHRQASFTELLLGSYYKFNFNKGSRYTGYEKPMSLSLGLFGRLKDAAIFKLILQWDQFSIGYAYDINTSSLSSYTNGAGANEIFIRFNANDGGGFRSRSY